MRKNPCASYFLGNLNFLLSHNANFDKSTGFLYLSLQLLSLYSLLFFCTSNNLITLFYNQIKIFHKLLKSLKIDIFFDIIIFSKGIIIETNSSRLISELVKVLETNTSMLIQT